MAPSKAVHPSRQALNEQLFICISIKHLQDMKNRQTVSKQRVNLFAARALPRVCGAYLAQAERFWVKISGVSIWNWNCMSRIGGQRFFQGTGCRALALCADQFGYRHPCVQHFGPDGAKNVIER